jgi:hypothetical protein
MMRREKAFLLVLALTTGLLPAFGAVSQAVDEALIRESDVPADAPRFEAYAAKPYTGANAVPDVDSDPRSRRYRTQLRRWAREKPNFAGHYILATWGCGTGCTELAVIDAATGKVFHPPEARANHIEDVDPDALVEINEGERRADFGAMRYRADSRLLIVFGALNGRAENEGISWFVWEDDKLRRVRFVRKAPPAGKN